MGKLLPVITTKSLSSEFTRVFLSVFRTMRGYRYKMVRQSTPAPAIYDSKSVTVRGMIPNQDQHLLFTVKFSDKQLAENLMFLLSANNPEAALAIMRQSDSL